MEIVRTNVYNKLMLLYAFSIPFVGFHLPKYVLGSLIIISIILLYKNLKISPNNSIKLILMSSLYVIFVLGMLYTENIGNGIRELEKKLYLFLIPLIFAVYCSSSENKVLNRKDFFNYYIYGLVGVILLAIVIATIKIVDQGAFYYEFSEFKYKQYFLLYDTFSNHIKLHPSYFSIMLSIGLFYLVLKKNKEKKDYILIIVFIIVNILLLSRTSLLGTIFILIFLILRTQKIKIIIPSFLVISSVIIFVFTMNISVIKKRLLNDVKFSVVDYSIDDHRQWTSFNQRLAIWDCTMIALSNSSLFFGVGTGDNKDTLMNVYENKNFKRGIMLKLNEHNQFFTFMLQLGFLGILTFFLMFIGIPLYFNTSYDTFYLVFIIYIFFMCLTESIFSREQGLIIIIFLNSVLGFIPKEDENIT